MRACFNCSKEIHDSFKFCPHCGTDIRTPRPCPKCGYENEPNSKFCQECGNSLNASSAATAANTSHSAVNEMEPPPASGITIEFPYSTAQSFEFAVQSAQALPNFKQFGDGKKAVYRVTVSQKQMEDLDELVENLKGWRKRVVYTDGTKAQWDSVFGYTWCYARKKSSYKPELYCFGYENDWEFNLWGCIQAHMPFTERSDWFTYGKWVDKSGTWEFDKDRIRHELEKKLYTLRFCPGMNTSLVEEILVALPDQVNPNHDKDWIFLENYSNNEGLIITKSYYGNKEQVVVNGVGPNGKGAIKKILRSIPTKLPQGLA